MGERLGSYFDTLFKATREAECTDAAGLRISMDAASQGVCELCHAAHDAGGKVIFIGNGGSMGIATHMAIDFSKNGNLRALAFNDPMALTCVGNDLGYANVFAKQIEIHARPGDLLVAISSSGRSPNILAAVAAARARDCAVATYSGFAPDNDLRRLGDVNFYVAASEYGFVEISHLALCHAVLDIDMGWGQ